MVAADLLTTLLNIYKVTRLGYDWIRKKNNYAALIYEALILFVSFGNKSVPDCLEQWRHECLWNN